MFLQKKYISFSKRRQKSLSCLPTFVLRGGHFGAEPGQEHVHTWSHTWGQSIRPAQFRAARELCVSLRHTSTCVLQRRSSPQNIQNMCEYCSHVFSDSVRWNWSVCSLEEQDLTNRTNPGGAQQHWFSSNSIINAAGINDRHCSNVTKLTVYARYVLQLLHIMFGSNQTTVQCFSGFISTLFKCAVFSQSKRSYQRVITARAGNMELKETKAPHEASAEELRSSKIY